MQPYARTQGGDFSANEVVIGVGTGWISRENEIKGDKEEERTLI
jgi:hypothetical protein